MTPEVWDAAWKVGFPFVLILVALITGARQDWVWGWAYRQMMAERDEWREIAQSLKADAERGQDVARRAAQRVRR